MKTLFAFIISLFALTVFGQQTIQAKLLNSELLKENEVFLCRDIFDNVYTLNDNVLKSIGKYSNNQFSLPRLGKLSQVDLTNSMFPVLYYGDFKSIVLLSKEFALLNTIDLPNRFPNIDPAYVATSTGKNLWIVNQTRRTVILYNLATLEMRSVTTLKDEEIKTYQSSLNYLYWVTKDNVLNGIDIHGNEVLKYSLETDFDRIQIINNEQFFYLLKNKLYFVDSKKNIKYEVLIEEKTILNFFYNTQKLSIFADHKLTNYQIKLP